jgi:microsomal dipeptidase-like Zn-dependent dipeptidase
MLKIVKIAAGLLAFVAVGAVVLAASGWLGAYLERDHNTVYPDADAPVPSGPELALHRSLFIIDLHADTMMWDRDLLQRADYGHVDLPRLIEGNVAIQVFFAVTKTPPKGPAPAGSEVPECIDANGLNHTGLLQIVQLRPVSTWFDLEARALHQAKRLRDFVALSQKRHAEDPSLPVLKLILTADDLRNVVERRAAGEPVVGALLALEGAHWLGGPALDEARLGDGLDELWQAGFRMLAPTHRFTNSLAASSEGCVQSAGLTEQGRAFLVEADKRGFILDLAHASGPVVSDAARSLSAPIVVSHTGVRAACETDAGCQADRNLTDAEVHAVARTGGIVGLGYWPEATGRSIASIVAAFASAHRALNDPTFVAEMSAGGRRYDPLNHLALGSDFDGDTTVPFDAAGLPTLTAALARHHNGSDAAPFDEAALRRIMGTNACRIFALQLDGGGAAAAEEICSPLNTRAIRAESR